MGVYLHCRASLARRRRHPGLSKHEQALQRGRAHLGVAHDLRRKVRNLLARLAQRAGALRRLRREGTTRKLVGRREAESP